MWAKVDGDRNLFEKKFEYKEAGKAVNDLIEVRIRERERNRARLIEHPLFRR